MCNVEDFVIDITPGSTQMLCTIIHFGSGYGSNIFGWNYLCCIRIREITYLRANKWLLLRELLNLDHIDRWYMQKLENETLQILWYLKIKGTNQSLPEDQMNEKKNTCHLMDFSLAADRRIEIKEKEILTQILWFWQGGGKSVVRKYNSDPSRSRCTTRKIWRN